MSGDLIVSSDRVDRWVHFTQLSDSARAPGWYQARCDTCDAETSGSSPVVEEWAHQHVDQAHPPAIEITKTLRGFQVYGEPVEDTYGLEVQVYESSTASGPHVWLRIKDRQDFMAKEPRAAHLTIEQATAVRDRLTLAIKSAKTRWSD